MFKSILATAAVLAVASLDSADAHSRMTLPKPNSEINDSPSGTINGPSALPVPSGMFYDRNYDSNQAAYQKAFDSQTKYKSLRDLIYANFKPDGGATKECGRSAMTGPAQSLPDYVEYSSGFSDSHWGPCEVWCDDVRVFADENCAVKYKTRPAKLPYDKAKCAGAKRLQSFWLALHVAEWQAYISCATISGGGGGATAGGTAAGNSTTGGGGNSNNRGNNRGNGGQRNNGGQRDIDGGEIDPQSSYDFNSFGRQN